jgi:predicted HTH domain antitoxin
LDELVKYVSLVSSVFTILASGIAIYLFVVKRKSISSIFSLLINYSYQLTLSELKEKLEKLNDYNAKDSEQNEHIVNILNEIIGQVRGNDKLKSHFSELLKTMENLVSDKRRLTEPRKRALVSELRERIRHLNVKNIDNLVGE